jgi:hypothetical protein
MIDKLRIGRQEYHIDLKKLRAEVKQPFTVQKERQMGRSLLLNDSKNHFIQAYKMILGK